MGPLPGTLIICCKREASGQAKIRYIKYLQCQFGDRKGTTKKLCDKDFAERSDELSGAICLKTIVLLGNDPVIPSNCSDNSLVLLMRILGFVSPFWLLINFLGETKETRKP